MKKTSAIKIAGYAGFILTLFFLIYFLRKVDISLTYYWQQSIPLSFSEALQYPGDISGIMGDRFLELLTRPFLGIMGVTLLVVIVFFMLYIIFRRFRGSLVFFPLLLAALIPYIMLFAHYRLPAGLIMCVTTGLLLAAIHSLYSPVSLAVRTGYSFITGIIVYLVAGSAGLLVLVQVMIIQTVLSKKYLGLAAILPVLLIPLLYLPFNLSYTARFAYLGPFLISKYDEIPLILYISLSSPLMLLLVFTLLNYIFSRFAVKHSLMVSGTAILIVLAGLVFATLPCIIKEERNVLKIFQAAFRNDGETVVKFAKKQLFIDRMLQFEINRALYQNRCLLDSLFHYPQQFGEKGLFLEDNITSRVSLHISNFYYDLGFANEARHWSTEAQMVLSRHPVVLKHLVMTYIAIGNNETALKYLHVLSGSWLYRDWCDRVNEMIESNTTLNDQAIRSFVINNPRIDYFSETKNPTKKIMIFYGSNPDNNMAFEFIMASYLLQHQIGNVLIHLQDFRKFGYDKLPRAVEEAMLIYIARSKESKPSLAGYSISQNTVEEFRDFSRLLSGTANKTEGMRKVSKYKNTYWYYVWFTSPYASK